MYFDFKCAQVNGRLPALLRPPMPRGVSTPPRHLLGDGQRCWPIVPTPSVLSLPLGRPSLPPLCPAYPGGLFSCPARANPRLGVSRASRFLVLRKEEQGVGVGQRRRQTGGSDQPREPAGCTEGGPTRRAPTHGLPTKTFPLSSGRRMT